MATMYCTGPVLVWLGPQLFSPAFGATLPAGAPQFLGTAEVSPQAEIRRQYQPAYNDLSGAVPFDLNFLGEDCVGAIDLTRWNEPVQALADSAPKQFATTGPPTRGTYAAVGDMGVLQAHLGYAMTLYFVFPYGSGLLTSNAVMVVQGMPTGYRFHGVSCINTKLHQMGSKYRKNHLTFQGSPIYDYTTGLFHLYDHGIPSGLFVPPSSAAA